MSRDFLVNYLDLIDTLFNSKAVEISKFLSAVVQYDHEVLITVRRV